VGPSRCFEALGFPNEAHEATSGFAARYSPRLRSRWLVSQPASWSRFCWIPHGITQGTALPYCSAAHRGGLLSSHKEHAALHGAPKHALRRRAHAAASVRVSRSPVSRLVSGGVCRCADRVVIADAVRTASGRVLVLSLITRLRRRDDRKGRPPPGATAAGFSGGTASDAATRARVAGLMFQLCAEGSHRGDPAPRDPCRRDDPCRCMP
jgi:hypothetical protein